MRDQRYPFDGVDRFFDQMRREMFGASPGPAIGGGHDATAGTDDSTVTRQSGHHWDAGISVEATDDGFVVLADLPGFDRDELSLRLHDDTLDLSGEHEVGDGRSYRSRRVSERIALPASVDPHNVTASYHNGVLEVRFVAVSDDESGTDIDIE